MSKKRYFWLKLPKDFFKRHDMRIIEGMPNGKDMLLLYMKLLCESIDHEGSLRYSEKIPYTPEMLATIMNTDVEIVKQALAIFKDLGLIEIRNDKTIFMTKVPDMTGSETKAAQYMREYRKDTHLLGEFSNVELTKDEIKSLQEFYPKSWARYVEKLSLHKKSRGKVYESDYATIKQWLLVDIGDMEETR